MGEGGDLAYGDDDDDDVNDDDDDDEETILKATLTKTKTLMSTRTTTTRTRFSKIFRFFRSSEFSSEIDRAAAIQSARKSLKSELSSQFFGHLKIFHPGKRFLRCKESEIQIGPRHYIFKW